MKNTKMTNTKDNTQKYAVHFGAGNIGRGFIGQLLAKAGYHITFIDIQQDIIHALHLTHSYDIEVIKLHDSSTANIVTETVTNIDGVMSNDTDTVMTCIARASIVTTAVGPNVLKIVAKTLASALEYRFSQNLEPLNIIACENLTEASVLLKTEILQHLPAINFKHYDKVGFPCCAVDRIVVNSSSGAGGGVGSVAKTSTSNLAGTGTKNGTESGTGNSHIQLVRVEEYFEWIIDRDTIVGDLPDIPLAIFTDKLDAFVERKLFTLNTGHATLAYLGYIYGHSTIFDAASDYKLKTIALGAMQESSKALIAKWGLDSQEQDVYIAKTLKRFLNPELDDKVYRVAREPLRKLAANDRLIKPLQYCISYNLPYSNLIKSIAAALLFDYKDDSSALELQAMIVNQGLETALKNICNLQDNAIILKITEEYKLLKLLKK